MRSILELTGMFHHAIGARALAESTVPSGQTSFRLRNAPALAGSVGVVRYLNAMRATASAARELYGPSTCGEVPVKSTVISLPLTTTFTRSGMGLSKLMPSLSRRQEAS